MYIRYICAFVCVIQPIFHIYNLYLLQCLALSYTWIAFIIDRLYHVFLFLWEKNIMYMKQNVSLFVDETYWSISFMCVDAETLRNQNNAICVRLFSLNYFSGAEGVLHYLSSACTDEILRCFFCVKSDPYLVALFYDVVWYWNVLW